MYVDILSSALDGWVNRLTDDALVEYALMCRAQLRSSTGGRDESAYTSLAADIAYDRALIHLCETRDLMVSITNFAFPREERARIERRLARAGLDLDVLSRRRRPTASRQGQQQSERATPAEPGRTAPVVSRG